MSRGMALRRMRAVVLTGASLWTAFLAGVLSVEYGANYPFILYAGALVVVLSPLVWVLRPRAVELLTQVSAWWRRSQL